MEDTIKRLSGSTQNIKAAKPREAFMLVAFLAFALFCAGGPAHASYPDHSAIVLTDDAAPKQKLRDSLMAPLMDRFHWMNDTKQGIFQDDVTSIVAPYFPPGQTFAETKKIIKEQDLGTLQKFKGLDEPGGRMYVSKFSLMNGMFSQVYVVLDFDFVGQNETDMVVRKVGGFLRANAM
jgi:hypothetical protein